MYMWHLLLLVVHTTGDTQDEHPFVLVDVGPTETRNRSLEKIFGEQRQNFPVRKSSQTLTDVKFQQRNVRDGGTIMQMVRKPLEYTIRGFSQTLDLTKFIEREEELLRSIENFIEAPRVATPSVSETFNPVEGTSKEVRVWSQTSFLTCQNICVFQNSEVLQTEEIWKGLISNDPQLDVWTQVDQNVLDHSEKLIESRLNVFKTEETTKLHHVADTAMEISTWGTGGNTTVYENQTERFTSPGGTELWGTKSCICERNISEITTKRIDDAFMRQQRVNLLENTLKMKDDSGKEYIIHPTGEPLQKGSSYDVNSIWKIDPKITPILHLLNNNPGLNLLSPDEFLEETTQIIEREFHMKNVIMKQEVDIRLSKVKKIQENLKKKVLKFYLGGIIVEPQRSLVKLPAGVLTEEIAKLSKQATLESVLEMGEMRTVQTSFHHLEMISPLPRSIYETMSMRKEHFIKAMAIIYQNTPGKSNLLLLIITKRKPLYQRLHYNYVSLPRKFNQETKLFLLPVLTKGCRETMESQQDLKVQVKECNVEQRLMPAVWEKSYEEEQFSLVRIIGIHPVNLDVFCPEAYYRMEECRGICLIQLGYQCRLQYQGELLEGGLIMNKVPIAEGIEDKLISRTYLILYNEDAVEENYQMNSQDTINIIITLLIGTFISLIINVAMFKYARQRSINMYEFEDFKTFKQRRDTGVTTTRIRSNLDYGEEDVLTQVTELGEDDEESSV